MRLKRLHSVTLDERKGLYLGTYYCTKCSGTHVSANGTVYHDAKRQEWLDSGDDVDNWYCNDCQDAAIVTWCRFIQFFLWDDDEELFYVEE